MGMLADLFLTFAKAGMFTFGGGYAMVALITHECVEDKKWITQQEMMDVTVIAESTPGPIAINCATYVGYKQKGLAGAAVATLGIVLPSFCIIYLISLFLDHYIETGWIAGAMRGIRAAAGLLIVDAALKMIRKMPKKKLPAGIMVSAFLSMLAANLFSLPVSSIAIMALAALISLSVSVISSRKGETR